MPFGAWCLLAVLGFISIPLWFVLDLFFPLRPFRVRSLFPHPPRGPNWFSGTVGGIPFLIEEGLPYPCALTASSRRRFDLNGSWRLRFEREDCAPREVMDSRPEEWEEGIVPSVYNAASGGRTDYLGVVWYRKEFRFTEKLHPLETARLCLHGVLLRGRVWLNGRELGSIEGGYTPRYFDVTESLRGENVLFVMTDNRLTADSLPMKTMEGHNPGWHTYGGIHRPVEIETLPPRYVVKASARAIPVSAGRSRIEVEALICGRPSDRSDPAVPSIAADAPDRPATARALGAELRGPDGSVRRLALRPVARAELVSDGPVGARGPSLEAWRGSAEVDGLRLWSPDDPALYDLALTLSGEGGEADRVSLTTGFRTFTVDGERFLLNGEPVFLKGICKHEDHPDLGPVQTEELIEGDLLLIREAGANYVRLAHYPHDERELSLSRDLGLMLSEEIPLYQAGSGFTAWFQEKRPWRAFPRALFGLRQTASRALIDNARRQIAEMIQRDAANPAVIFWSVGNECYTLGRRSGRLFSALRDTAKFFDPDRPVTNVELTYHIPVLDAMRRGWTDMDFYCLNSYFGWYYGSLGELPAFLARQRRRWKAKPLVLSEFGADAALGRRDADGEWVAERVGGGKTYSEEYQETILRGYCAEAAKRSWIAGLSPWVYCDFYNTWFPHNPVPNYNLKGLVSARREPKAAYRALKEIYRGPAF